MQAFQFSFAVNYATHQLNREWGG